MCIYIYIYTHMYKHSDEAITKNCVLEIQSVARNSNT